MKKTEMLYKADTGQRPMKEIESEKMTNYFGRKTTAIDLNAFPENYIKGNNLLVYTPEYIKWLEEKVEQLTSHSVNQSVNQ